MAESQQAYSMAPHIQFEERRATMIEVRTNHEDELRKMEALYRGLQWDDQTKKFKCPEKFDAEKGVMVPDKNIHARMNDAGVAEFMKRLRNYTSKVFKLTNLDSEDVVLMFRLEAKSIGRLLAFYCDEYQIDRADRFALMSATYNFMLACLKIPENDLERQHWDSSGRYIETNVMREPQQTARPSLFGGM